MLYGTKNYYAVFRFFYTLYERIKLAKNIVADKLRADIQRLKEETNIDTSEIEDNFEQVEKYRFRCVIATVF